MNKSPSHFSAINSKFKQRGKWATVLLIAMVLGKSTGPQGFQSFWVQKAEAAPGFPARAWAKRDFGNISLDAPFAFGSGLDISNQLPAGIKAALDNYQILDSGEASPSFRVAITRVTYKKGVRLSLDGAVKGAITQAAAAAGDGKPKFTSTSTSVNQLPARRVKYRGQIGGSIFHIDGLFVLHQQKMWQIQTLYVSDAAASDAKRLLDSVRIFPSK